MSGATYWGLTKVDQIGSLDFSAANAVALAFGQPADVKRIVASITVATTGAAGSVITVQKIPLASGTASPVTLGTFTIPTGVAAGTELEVLPGKANAAQVAISGAPGIGGQYTNDAKPDELEFDTGNQIRLLSDGGGDAGTAIFWVEYQEQPNVKPRFTATELTFT